MGTAYSRNISASGGTPPYLFVANGQLARRDLALELRRVSGTPVHAGAYPLSIQVTDASGQTVTQPCTLPVNASQLVIQEGCPLPPARVGVAYSSTLTAGGGIPPYVFTAIGGVPAGLILNPDGTITGTPTDGGRLSGQRARHRLPEPHHHGELRREREPARTTAYPLCRHAGHHGSGIGGTDRHTDARQRIFATDPGRLNLTVTPDTGSTEGSSQSS